MIHWVIMYLQQATYVRTIWAPLHCTLIFSYLYVIYFILFFFQISSTFSKIFEQLFFFLILLSDFSWPGAIGWLLVIKWKHVAADENSLFIKPLGICSHIYTHTHTHTHTQNLVLSDFTIPLCLMVWGKTHRGDSQ